MVSHVRKGGTPSPRAKLKIRWSDLQHVTLLVMIAGGVLCASCLIATAAEKLTDQVQSDTARPTPSPFGWLMPVAQAAIPKSDPEDSSASTASARPVTGGAVLTPMAPQTPEQKEQGDALAAWQRSAQNKTTAPPLTISGSQAPLVTSAPEPVQGVTGSEIRFGMVGPFTGAVKESGRNLMIGVETAFGQLNDAGGVSGRQLKLITADDGYEPSRTLDAMRRLYEQDKVFGFICNFGTATAEIAAPYALEHKALFFGAFTGSPILRRDPSDRYIFNYRASYAEETSAILHYLVMVKRIRPDQIAVFAQEDGFGDAGYDGVQKEVRRLYGGRAADVLRLGYKRNTVDVADAVAQINARRSNLKAIIMVATYRGAAKLIERTRDTMPALIYTDVSGVGSTSLSDELTLLGPKYAAGVIVTQIVPSVDSYATAILDYKAALNRAYPGEKPDYVSLEGFISAKILIEALKRAGPNLDTEKVVDALQGLRDFDLGLGTLLSFTLSNHQATHKIWATVLNGTGQ